MIQIIIYYEKKEENEENNNINAETVNEGLETAETHPNENKEEENKN